MSQTVVGIFDQLSEARNAETLLLASGFDPAMVDISSGRRESSTREAAADTVAATESESSVKRFFKSLFDSEPDAERYAGVAASSEALVTVHAATADQALRAAQILDSAGSIDVDAHAASLDTVEDRDGGTGSVKVIQENLQVGKRTVETGGARIRSRIVERAVSEDIRLKQERVLVERRPVDRIANAADLSAFREGQIEIIEHAEIPVVAKEVRVVEEVSLKKEQNERTETVSDTVRSTEVVVESIDGTNRVVPDRR